MRVLIERLISVAVLERRQHMLNRRLNIYRDSRLGRDRDLADLAGRSGRSLSFDRNATDDGAQLVNIDDELWSDFTLA